MPRSSDRQRQKRRRERERRRQRVRVKGQTLKRPDDPSLATAAATGDPVRGTAAERIDQDLRWHMIRIAPRMGVRALRALREAKVATVTPRVSEVVVRRGRRVIRHTPLIIRTVFVGVRDDAHLEEVRVQPGIAEIVSHPENEGGTHGNVAGTVMRPARLDPKALQHFVDALAGSEIVEPVGVKAGSSVVVVSGPFSNFPATVEAILPHDRLRVAVMIFGRPSRLDISIADVQRV